MYGPIGKEIGVSATPVREAAGHLANEGLVDLVPNRGAIVRSLSRTDLIEIYETREIIEAATAALAATRITPAQVMRIESELALMRSITAEHVASKLTTASPPISKRFDRADRQFHERMIEATGNKALVRTASQSHILSRVFGIRRHSYTGPGMRRTCDEHQRILDAIKKGDAEAARAATAVHIQNGLADSLASIDSGSGG